MTTNNQKLVLIIGAGPAGLTAAYELATRSNHKVILLEATDQFGGISKTVDYKGYKIDIGGHRFFSKSDWVINWWQQFMPIASDEKEIQVTFQNASKTINLNNGKHEAFKKCLHVRPRKSRIFYKGVLFDYPLKINVKTLFGLGILKSIKIVFSMVWAKMFPIRNEENLEHFFINRFGKELYKTFFKSYTHKVWGKSCTEISAEWGKQRVKSLGVRKILKHYLGTLFYPTRLSIKNSKIEQSLIEEFLYPPKGPGQLWEIVAERCRENNVDIRMNQRVEEIHSNENNVKEIVVRDLKKETSYSIKVDHVISTMPIKHLIRGMKPKVPEKVYQTGTNLAYRDFLIVGVLLDDILLKENGIPVKDNWLYIQDKGYKLGRVQMFHNWSKELLADTNKFWIGAEYFCDEGDDLWELSEEEMIQVAVDELEKIGLISSSNVLDAVVVKEKKAYPSYVGMYNDFQIVKDHLDTIENLFLIGRNGMHKYNNQDHSMLTARTAVDSILANFTGKTDIWKVNMEQEYQEEKSD